MESTTCILGCHHSFMVTYMMSVSVFFKFVIYIYIFPKQNVVVSRTGDCLLCDFGLSRIKHEMSRSQTIVHQGGRQRFIAPEISSGAQLRINEKSDVYSLAMTVYALGARSLPFKDARGDIAACSAAQQGKRPEKCNSLGGLSTEETALVWFLMEEMWNHIPQDRPTMSSARDTMMEISLNCLQSTTIPIPCPSTSIYPSIPTTILPLNDAHSPISHAREMFW